MLTESPTVSPLSLIDDEHKRKLHTKLTDRIHESTEHTYTASSDDVIDAWEHGHREIVNGPLGGGLSKRLKVPADVMGNFVEETSALGTLAILRERYNFRIAEISRFTVDSDRSRWSPGLHASDRHTRRLTIVGHDLIIKRMGVSDDWIGTGKVGKTRAGRVIARIRAEFEALEDAADLGYVRSLIETMEELNTLAAQTIRVAQKQEAKPYHVTVSACPLHIERLGRYEPCKAGHSCYKTGGAYSLSPIVIAQTTGSFVCLLEDSEGIFVARAWGVWQDGQAVITNIYPNTTGGLRSVMPGVLDYAMQEVFGLKPGSYDYIHNQPDACYLNGDSRAYGPDDRANVYLNDDNVEDHGGCCCTDCGEHCHEDDTTYIENHGDVCEYCRDNYVWIESQDAYADVDDCCGDYNGEWILSSEATELYDGEYAHDDDDDLVELCDGSWAVFKHHDVIEIHTGEYAVRA